MMLGRWIDRERIAAMACVVAGLIVTTEPLAGQELAGAAESVLGDTLVLTFEEALRRGFDGGEEILSARARIDQAQAGVTIARSDVLPQLISSLSYQRVLASPLGEGFSFADSLNTFEPDTTLAIEDRVRYLERRAPSAPLSLLGGGLGGLPFGQEHTYVASLSLSQTIFAGGRIRGSVRRAKAETGAARAQLQATEADLIFAIGQSYLDALLAARRIAIAEATLVQIEAQLEQVRLENRAGNASELDVLRVQVERANAEPGVVTAENALDAAELELKRLTNLPSTRPIRLVGELNAADFEPVGDMVLDRYLGDQLVARRPDVQAAARQVDSRRASVDIAQAAFWPEIVLSGSLAGQALPQDFIPDRSDFQMDASIGLRIQLPLFQGLRRKGNLEAARAAERQAELDLVQRRQSAEVEIAQARAELRRTQALIEARAQAVHQATRVHELTELSYQQGVDTFLELNDARLALQESRLNEAQAVHDYYLALARLLRAAGEPPREQLTKAQTLLQLPQSGGTIDP